MIRRFAAASAAIVLACELSACSHGSAVACEPTARYAAAATAGPVRIPDDLNPPDETDSLRLPPDTGPTAQASKPCLETPPGFYADGAANAPRGGAGQRRTGSGGAATTPRAAAPPPQSPPAPTPAASSPPPPVAAPAPPPADAPPPAGDREINN